MKIIFVTVFLLCSSVLLAQETTVAFTIKEKDLIPEGITYDPAEQAFYLSSINKRKVVKITSKGLVSDFISSAQDSVQQVLGMTVHDGNLWLCNNTPEHDTAFIQANLHVYNLKSRKLIHRFKIQDGTKHLFNDIYLTKNGDAYITDSEAGAVYRVRNNSKTLEEFLPPRTLIYPNGITASEDEGKIFISTGSGRGIVSIDVQTKKIETLANERFMTFGYDGLYRYKNSLIGVQNVLFPEAIHQLFVNSGWTQSETLKLLIAGDPRFDIPTTGVVVGDSFYFIANSQLRQIGDTDGKLQDPKNLKETIILKLKLN